MIKKLVVIFLVSLMVLSIVACGDKESKKDVVAEKAVKSNVTEDTKEFEEEDLEEDTEEFDLSDLEEVITEAYKGLTNSAEEFYYAGNDDGSFTIILVVNPETGETTSLVGACEQGDDNLFTVTDEDSGSSLTFSMDPQDDGGILLDLGDLGQAVIAKVDTSYVLKVINDKIVQ